MEVHNVIIKNIVTEKSSRAQEDKHYTFQISKDATKVDVKKAVKEIYGADVNKVTVKLTPKKVRLIGKRRPWVKRPVMKVAVVSLKGGKSIDPNKLKSDKKK